VTGLSDRLLFLRNRADIERVKKSGRRFQTPLFHLVSSTSIMPQARVGIVVGKRFGTAVARNRAKRIFRELARQVRQELEKGHDLLVFPRREALTVPHHRLRANWTAALRHEGVLTSESEGECGHSASR
jgi:ribonuclease P protein component